MPDPSPAQEASLWICTKNGATAMLEADLWRSMMAKGEMLGTANSLGVGRSGPTMSDVLRRGSVRGGHGPPSVIPFLTSGEHDWASHRRLHYSPLLRKFREPSCPLLSSCLLLVAIAHVPLDTRLSAFVHRHPIGLWPPTRLLSAMITSIPPSL